jgi:hypothetical protein
MRFAVLKGMNRYLALIIKLIGKIYLGISEGQIAIP